VQDRINIRLIKFINELVFGWVVVRPIQIYNTLFQHDLRLERFWGWIDPRLLSCVACCVFVLAQVALKVELILVVALNMLLHGRSHITGILKVNTSRHFCAHS
jgi:hypothetical protein